MSKNNIKSKNSFSEKEFLLVFSQCWYKGIIMATKALSIKREIPMHPPHQKTQPEEFIGELSWQGAEKGFKLNYI